MRDAKQQCISHSDFSFGNASRHGSLQSSQSCIHLSYFKHAVLRSYPAPDPMQNKKSKQTAVPIAEDPSSLQKNSKANWNTSFGCCQMLPRPAACPPAAKVLGRLHHSHQQRPCHDSHCDYYSFYYIDLRLLLLINTKAAAASSYDYEPTTSTTRLRPVRKLTFQNACDGGSAE